MIPDWARVLVTGRPVLLRAWDRYGSQVQAAVAIEELSELVAVVARTIRGRSDADRQNLIDEWCDALIGLEHIRAIHGFTDEEMAQALQTRIERLRDRMGRSRI